jgi:transcriptional accessory protein Tex/SPT6
MPPAPGAGGRQGGLDEEQLRHLSDLLAGLVKIDPKSIGVGLYQHDVSQKQLSEALDEVVESVVNRVGVDVNAVSPALLTHVAGIGPKLAERIAAYRVEFGAFVDLGVKQDSLLHRSQIPRGRIGLGWAE